MKQTIHHGFTLVELMVVVAIIAILVAVSLPAYQNHTRRTHIVTGMQLAAPIKTAIVSYHTSQGDYPVAKTAHEVLGLAKPQDFKSEALNSITVGDQGVITLAYNQKISGNSTQMQYLSLKPTSNGAVYQWQCILPAENGVDTQYAPENCQSDKALTDG